jgi:hypothetical protein
VGINEVYFCSINYTVCTIFVAVSVWERKFSLGGDYFLLVSHVRLNMPCQHIDFMQEDYQLRCVLAIVTIEDVAASL